MREREREVTTDNGAGGVEMPNFIRRTRRGAARCGGLRSADA